MRMGWGRGEGGGIGDLGEGESMLYVDCAFGCNFRGTLGFFLVFFKFWFSIVKHNIKNLASANESG